MPHQKGIIHRDLKPTNVLVTLHDTKPVVKVIDFGVAKATGQKLTEKTLFTGLTQMIGTPLYMSPEQAELSGLDVDTRSDIYSLGVLLYELLTGHTPFDNDRLKAAAFDELRRIIREEEPPRPSTRVSTLAQQDSSTISEKRNTDPRHLSRLFQGELDWIVMKCLEKDRSRRYETASALAADVEHYLRDEPVQACPPSAIYRFRKFTRRNKWAFTSAAILTVLLLIIVGVVAGSVGWVASDRATRQAALGQKITQALDEAKTWIQSGKPNESVAAVKRAEDLLASGGGSDELKNRVVQWRSELETIQRLEQIRLDEASPLIALVAAEVEPLGDSGSKPNSEKVDMDKTLDWAAADRAYRKEFRRYGIDLDSLDIEKSSQRIRNSLIREELVVALDDWFHVTCALESSATTKQPAGKKELLQIARLVDSDPWRDRLRDAIQRDDDTALIKLARENDALGQATTTVLLLVSAVQARDKISAEAIEILRQAQRRHPADLWVNVELANYLSQSSILEEVGFRRIAVALCPNNPVALNSLGAALDKQGNHTEAEAVEREAIRIKPDYARAYLNLGSALSWQGKGFEAEAACREAIRLDPDFEFAYFNLGVALSRQGNYAEAEAAYRDTIRLNPNYLNAHQNLGFAQYRQNKNAEAEAEFRAAIRLKPDFAIAYCTLGAALDKLGRHVEAKGADREAIRLMPDDPNGHLNLGFALSAQGRHAEAEPEYREGVRLKFDFEPAHFNLGNCLSRLHKYAEAEVEYRRSRSPQTR